MLILTQGKTNVIQLHMNSNDEHYILDCFNIDLNEHKYCYMTNKRYIANFNSNYQLFHLSLIDNTMTQFTNNIDYINLTAWKGGSYSYTVYKQLDYPNTISTNNLGEEVKNGVLYINLI